MLKRFVVLFLIGAVAVGLVPTASARQGAQIQMPCGTDQDVTITFIAGQVGGEFELAQKMAAEFTSKVCPNIAVKVVARPASTTDTLAQYQQFLAGHSADLDVFMVDVAWPGLIAEGLVDLTEYLDAKTLSRFFPGLLDAYTVKGRLVGLPWFADSGMFYYRTDLLDKYGLEVPKTWDELATAAKTIQDGERAAGNPDFWGFVFQGAAYEGLTCDALEWQVSSGGGRILSPDGVIEVNNPETIEILDKIASWVGDFVPPDVVSYQEEESRAVWQAGNAAFMRNWPYAYNLGQAEDSPIKDKFGVGPLPGKETGMSAATLGGWGLSVSKYSANPEAAVAFANWWTDYDALKEWNLERGQPLVLPALFKDVDLLAASPLYALTGNVLDFATARPTGPAGEQYATVSQDYYTAVNAVLSGQQDATTAMSNLELQLADLGFKLP